MIRNYGVTLCVALMFAIPASLFFWLAFPPRKLCARLCIGNGRISYIPGWFGRLTGEAIQEASITPHSDEIFICRNLLEGFNGGWLPDGYRVIVCAVGKTERELRADFLATLDTLQREKIAAGITVATGLPVQFLLRHQSMTGQVEDIPWPSTTQETNFRLAAGLSFGFAPFIGGLIVGHFVTQPSFIVGIGFAIWLVQMLFLCLLDKRKWTLSTAMYSMTTLVTFAAVYSLCVVLAAWVFRGH